MRHWQDRWTTDLGLRLGGAMLCGVSGLAIHMLVRMRLPPLPGSSELAALALAAIGFVCACLGVALLATGRHIFDQVETNRSPAGGTDRAVVSVEIF
jgi:hypothetical protein